jgi:glycosyltransferase involved in cell wall biosynthesis
VASVFQQTFEQWELINVDDASTDETGSWLHGLRDARVTSIRLEQHAERSKARNVGLEAARGDFVLFLDDDDLLPERALEHHVEALKPHPAAIASVGSVIRFDESGSRRTFRNIRRRTVRGIFQDALFGWTAISGQTLFRRHAIRSAGGWDEAYTLAEDFELWLRIGRLGSVVLLPDVVLLHRIHSGQWRPQKRERVMAQMCERAVATLEGRERRRAQRSLRARALAQRARQQYGQATAVILYLQVLQIAPGLLWSPLARRRIFRRLRRSLGTMGRRLGREFVSWMRNLIAEG